MSENRLKQGENWNENLASAIRRGKRFVIFVSAEFLRLSYFASNEFCEQLSRLNSEGKPVHLVSIDGVDLANSSLSCFSNLLDGIAPIVNEQYPEKAIQLIATELLAGNRKEQKDNIMATESVTESVVFATVNERESKGALDALKSYGCITQPILDRVLPRQETTLPCPDGERKIAVVRADETSGADAVNFVSANCGANQS